MACAVVEDILIEKGALTSRAHSVIEVVDRLSTFSPKLIILSHWLPEGNTLQLLETLRDKYSASVPVIVTLTSDALDEGIQSVNAGAFDCIYKPIQPADVLARVYRALKQVAFSHPGDREAIQPNIVDAIYNEGLLEPLMNALEQQFISRTSSELRQPLQTLLDFSQSIEDRSDSVDVHRAFAVFRDFLAAAKGLIASANPTELFSTLELDDNQQWRRRLDYGRGTASKPHLNLTAQSTLEKSSNDTLPGAAKKVG